ncbi:hypothetical protein NJC40_24675 [Pseudomonas sp. 21LCFQ02]|uniref:hypothetical protein n=1 Tax=Pseudomonas sp. 21LCFQ02 TaxID=2957505 RepID=UPI00209AF567|nr:hypothetical protein [Pseudomonas sp. 21LCFQ02]MCO8170966.1 hypothetical protein [Pseudomonas sp. 21LCFQ02]
MDTINTVASPTQEASERYFRNLPVAEHSRPRAFAPSALLLDDPADFAPRALAPSASADFMLPDTSIEPDSLADVSTESPLIIAFADGVSQANRSAVRLSMRFAETVARLETDGQVGGTKWLEHFTSAMSYGGWQNLNGFTFSEYSTANASLTMDTLVLELVSAIAGPNAATVVQLLSLTLDRLQSDSRLTTLFERNTQYAAERSFRIMPCLESSTGIPVTYLLAVDFSASQDMGGALFWKWRVSRLNIRRMAVGVEFNLDLHNDLYRKRILDYLGEDSDSFFASLPRR